MSKSETEHESLKCPVHGDLLVMRKNSRGDGTFWACREHSKKGCDVTWSDTHQLWYGHPAHVAKSSKKRSRCVSQREFVIAKLRACGAAERDILEIMNKGLAFAEDAAQVMQAKED